LKVIRVVAAENEYGNVAAQIGGKYVSVTSVESNPNTDPHTYEVSPGVAQAVSAAQVVIQNGVGYDDFMTKIESASANSKRRVIDVQHLLGLPDSTPNPHLWYNPTTCPRWPTPWPPTSPPSNRPTPPTSRPMRRVHHLAPPLAGGHRPFQADLPDTPGGHDRAGGRLHAGGGGTDNLTPFGFRPTS
jgi:hypothetical protein